jgi:hypothetical protein
MRSFLPRRARDKHRRESTQKQTPFLSAFPLSVCPEPVLVKWSSVLVYKSKWRSLKKAAPVPPSGAKRSQPELSAAQSRGPCPADRRTDRSRYDGRPAAKRPPGCKLYVSFLLVPSPSWYTTDRFQYEWVVGKERRVAPFMHKTIILPRQARDKHRESTQKRVVFVACAPPRPPLPRLAGRPAPPGACPPAARPPAPGSSERFPFVCPESVLAK